MDMSLSNYCNAHSVKTYAPLLGGPKEEPPPEIISYKKLQTMKLAPMKMPLLKKVTGLNLAAMEQQ